MPFSTQALDEMIPQLEATVDLKFPLEPKTLASLAAIQDPRQRRLSELMIREGIQQDEAEMNEDLPEPFPRPSPSSSAS